MSAKPCQMYGFSRPTMRTALFAYVVTLATFGLQAAANASCSVPVGGKNGVHYEGGNYEESELWGPKSFSVDPSGNIVVLDTAANRLLEYSNDCRFLSATALPDGVVGASDIKTSHDIWILDSSAARPAIWRLSRSGRLIAHTVINDPSLKQGNDIDGIELSDDGTKIVIERGFHPSMSLEFRTTATGEVVADLRNGQLTKSGVAYDAQITSNARGEAVLRIGGHSVPIKTHFPLIGLGILAVGGNGDSFLHVDESVNSQLLETVWRYDKEGNKLGMALVPHEGIIDIPHNTAVDATGNVYSMSAFSNHVVIRRLVVSDTI